MSDLVFYTNPISRGRNVRWMLQECGAHYETHYLTFNGSMKEKDFLKINPMGKVPTLVHEGKVVTETAAIITYLADIFPACGLVPKNRASYYRWIIFINGVLEAALIGTLFHADNSPQAQSVAGYGSLELAVHTLEDWLKDRPFIAGDNFSAADVVAASVINFGNKKGLLSSDILNSYAGRMCSRPAFLKACEIDNAKAKELAR